MRNSWHKINFKIGLSIYIMATITNKWRPATYDEAADDVVLIVSLSKIFSHAVGSLLAFARVGIRMLLLTCNDTIQLTSDMIHSWLVQGTKSRELEMYHEIISGFQCFCTHFIVTLQTTTETGYIISSYMSCFLTAFRERQHPIRTILFLEKKPYRMIILTEEQTASSHGPSNLDLMDLHVLTEDVLHWNLLS